MRNRKRVVFICAALVAGGSVPAYAQTATADFSVQITIEGECLVVAPEDMNFGTAGILNTNIDTEVDLTVTCTSGLSYDIALDAGMGEGATAEDRYMTGDSGETVTYSLYQDAGRNVLWGPDPDDLSGTGTGDGVTHTVYGRVPPQTTPPAGTYTDTVTVTVTY